MPRTRTPKPDDEPFVGNPWDRQPGESSRTYDWFIAYRDLGAGRTIDRAAQFLSKSSAKPVPSTTIKTNVLINRWVERAAAWDNHIQAERDRAEAEVEAEMARKRALLRVHAADALIKIAEQVGRMAAWPLQEVKTEKVSEEETTDARGKRTVVVVNKVTVKPARWSMQTVARFLGAIAEYAPKIMGGTLAPAPDADADADAANRKLYDVENDPAKL